MQGQRQAPVGWCEAPCQFELQAGGNDVYGAPEMPGGIAPAALTHSTYKCVHTCIPTYLPTYLATYLPTYLRTYMHAYMTGTVTRKACTYTHVV